MLPYALPANYSATLRISRGMASFFRNLLAQINHTSQISATQPRIHVVQSTPAHTLLTTIGPLASSALLAESLYQRFT